MKPKIEIQKGLRPIEELIQCHGEKDITTKPSTLEVRPTQWTITPKGEPIFDERAITLKIEDEAAGEFLILENCGDCGKETGFRFDADDWPTLRALIDEAVKEVKR